MSSPPARNSFNCKSMSGITNSPRKLKFFDQYIRIFNIAARVEVRFPLLAHYWPKVAHHGFRHVLLLRLCSDKLALEELYVVIEARVALETPKFRIFHHVLDHKGHEDPFTSHVLYIPLVQPCGGKRQLESRHPSLSNGAKEQSR